MTKPVATLEYIRGETIIFGIRNTTTDYLGTETVTCDLKVATNQDRIPDSGDAVILALTGVYVATVGQVVAHWLFTITAAQSALLTPDVYIADAKIVNVDTTVDYPAPILISISEHVTS